VRFSQLIEQRFAAAFDRIFAQAVRKRPYNPEKRQWLWTINWIALPFQSLTGYGPPGGAGSRYRTADGR